MLDSNKKASASRKKYLEYVFKIMDENETFLYENAEDVYNEIVELANDAIDYLGIFIKHRDEGIFVRYSILYFINHVLMPIGGAIWVNALCGNPPACFMELRLALESLCKCYLADKLFSDQLFFRDKMSSLEKYMNEKGMSISRIMKDLDKELGIEKESIVLWSSFSNNWLHAKGVMDGIVDFVLEKSDVPSWGLVIPMSYTGEDMSSLIELKKGVVRFRKLLHLVMQKFQETLYCA